MTLSIMEDRRTFKTALIEFQNSMGDIPKVLERYLEQVSRNGKPLFTWNMISGLILKKYENVCSDFPALGIQTNNSVDELKTECFKILNDFPGVPFTIQRICELLLNPYQGYSRLDKFLRGFYRVIKVVTVVDKNGKRITTEAQAIANAMSPSPMNESGDSWVSNHSDESSGVTQSISPTSDITYNNEGKCDLDYDDKCLEDTMCIMPDTITPYSSATTTNTSTPSLSNNSNLIQTTQSIYSNESFFLEQKTISMPPIGALFKPIDQLEAFVQNVSSQVESSNDSVVEVSKKRPADDSSLSAEDSNEASEYESPAKKSRLCDEEEEVSPQEAVATTSSAVLPEQCSEVEECGGDSSQEIVASAGDVPSRSCETSVCAEEASSSTNNDEEIDESGCVREVSVVLSSVGEVTSEVEGVVEPDQSNCDNGDQDEMEDECK